MWSIQNNSDVSADEVRRLVTALPAQREIKNEIVDGLEHLVEEYGEDVKVSLCASVTLQKAMG